MKQQSYQICDASYDPLLRQFVREDGHVETIAPLEGKVFLFLLENIGECIERGLIFERCWGNVIVSEQALTNVISKIRKTLNRVTCGCATIRTVSKTGYSLEIDESKKPNLGISVTSTNNLNEAEPPQGTADSLPKPQTSSNQKSLNLAVTQSDVVDIAAATSPKKQTQDSSKVQNSVESSSSKSVGNGKLVKYGYLAAFICILAIAFNLVRTYYTPQPYFVDKAEYRDNHTDSTNHYFFHIVHNEDYSLPAITEKLTSVIPSHCNVDVFIRIYPSVDQPESDALYMLIRRQDGEALNYVASVFNLESSFDSFAQHMEERSYFCD